MRNKALKTIQTLIFTNEDRDYGITIENNI
jgi:hypothetical protein